MWLLNMHTGKVERYTSASDAPPYAAISYVWPKEATFNWTTTTDLVIQSQSLDATGQKSRSTGQITPALSTAPFESRWPIPSCSCETLNKALTAIYQKGRYVLDTTTWRASKPTPPPRFTHLWMDVLCLNQLDETDKAEDIKNMKDFYSNAVCVWVFLNNLGEPDLPVTADGPARWFTRLWTLQECVLSKKLFFYLALSPRGKPDEPLVGQWVSRQHLASYIGSSSGMASSSIMKPADDAQAFRWGVQLMALGCPKPSIRVALMLSTVRECRYDVDRFYGIIGMLPTDRRLFDVDKLIVDYSKGFDEISESFASAIGPLAVPSFGFFAPPPKHIKTTQHNLKTSQKVGWFGNLEPGFYIVGSISHLCFKNDLTSFLTENDYDATTNASNKPIKRPHNLVNPSPPSVIAKVQSNKFQCVLLQGTYITPVTNIVDKGPNKPLLNWCNDSTEPLAEQFMKNIMSSTMSLIHAKDKYFKWAVKERRKFLNRWGRSLNMNKADEDAWLAEFHEPFKGMTDDKCGIDAGAHPAKNAKPIQQFWLNQLFDSFMIGLERMLQGAGIGVNGILFYPPFMRDLWITTGEGAKLGGFGSYVDANDEAGRLVLLLTSRTNSGEFTKEYHCEISDTHILARVIQEADSSKNQSMVVRKVGVVHVYNYYASFDIEIKRLEGSTDMVKGDVLVQ